MASWIPEIASCWTVAGAVVMASAGTISTAWAQPAPPAPDHVCRVDLDNEGIMKDIAWNALTRGLQRPEADVRAFMAGAEDTYPDGPALLKAAAQHFGVEEGVLRAEVERFKHVNCGVGITYGDEGESGDGESPANWGRHDAALAASDEAWKFARGVTLHVVLHEIGHGLIREFDIPILGNEETVADAFATYYLTTCMPDQALDSITARVTSLMIEAPDTPADDWSGEHNHDGRRAYQIAALAIAADAEKYAPVAAIVGMSEDDIDGARDYGGEIHRGWRRVLGPLWMPAGMGSTEARVQFPGDNPFMARLCADGLAAEIEAALRRFDWHSQVTVRFEDDDGGAGWSRGSRTVTVNSQYVARFVGQAQRALGTPHE